MSQDNQELTPTHTPNQQGHFAARAREGARLFELHRLYEELDQHEQEVLRIRQTIRKRRLRLEFGK